MRERSFLPSPSQGPRTDPFRGLLRALHPFRGRKSPQRAEGPSDAVQGQSIGLLHNLSSILHLVMQGIQTVLLLPLDVEKGLLNVRRVEFAIEHP